MYYKLVVKFELFTSIYAIYRFKIHKKMSDRTGSATFALFDREAEKLLECTASQPAQRHSQESSDIPLQIWDLYGRSFVFKIKLTDFNLKDGLQNDTVTKVFTINEKLENEFRFLPIKQATFFMYFMSKQMHRYKYYIIFVATFVQEIGE